MIFTLLLMTFGNCTLLKRSFSQGLPIYDWQSGEETSDVRRRENREFTVQMQFRVQSPTTMQRTLLREPQMRVRVSS